MRFLWIEDFGGGQEIENLRNNWLGWYQLNDEDVIEKSNLIEALEYIDSSPFGFDAVLLDIRFPIGKNVDSDDVYKKYFSEIITQKFYEQNAEDGCGAGILAFYYLVFVAKFPKNRIAFLSANIDEDKGNNYPEAVQEFLERLEKGTEKIDYLRNDIMNYFEDMNLPLDKFNVNWQEKELIDFLQNHKSIYELRDDIKINNSPLRYNTVKEEFSKIGIELKHSYPKPDLSKSIEGHTSDFSKKFIEINKSSYIEFRRSIINLAKILKENLSDELLLIRKKSYFGKSSGVYDFTYFNSLLDKVMDLPLSNYNDSKLIRQIIWELTQCMESAEKPVFFLPNDKICNRCLNFKECVMSKFGYKTKVNQSFKCNAPDNLACEFKDGKGDCTNRKSCIKANNYKIEDYLCEYEHECDYKYTLFEYASHSALKLTRNWLAHSKLDDISFSINFASFIIPLVFRFYFDVDKLSLKEEYYKCERILLEVKCNGKPLFDSEGIVDRKYKDCLKANTANVFKSSKKISPDLSFIFSEMGQRGNKLTCSSADILQAFTHVLLPTVLNPRINNSDISYGLDIEGAFIELSSPEQRLYLEYAYQYIPR